MSESSVKWESLMEVASLSDIGMRRTSNQDNFCVWLAPTLAQWESRGNLFVVADGMGAHAAGELASKIAVDNIPHLFNKYSTVPASEALRRALQDANSEIHRRGQANEDFHNMGTTCSTLLLTPEGVWAGHVGDSRVYRLRGTMLEQLTFDHSLVWEMRQQGTYDESESAGGTRIPKNVITRSLGPYPDVRIDLEGPFDAQVGDVFLLCSDGLTGQIEDSEIGALLHSLSPAEAVRVLVDLANLRGGPDNITVIVIRINSPQLTIQPTQQREAASSGRSAGGSSERFVGPLLWGLFTILLLAAGLLWIWYRNWLAILAPLLLAAGVLAGILIRSMRPQPEPVQKKASEPPSGKGPYVRIDCRSTAWKTVDHLRDMVQQIRLAGQQKHWRVDEADLKQRVGRAESVAATRDFRATLREYSLTISFLMDQLRRQ